ncbi:MAG TPA: cysteine desulfurase-like protein [Candidatus Limnocylindria bacterium]|nr:cysteine desulfurase-like protein [Candidatus Limnocylindria bacterium]
MTTMREQTGLDVAALRDHFPSLGRTLDGRPVAYLDGPGGTQVPRSCIQAISAYLERSNANHGGAFAASVETDALLDEVHAAGADFLGAESGDEIVFGPNMTTLTFAMSRALGRELRPGDEIVVTRLDHDANVAPWLAVAEDRGASVRWLELGDDGATLDLDGLERVITDRTRVVAIGLASNALGTVTDVARVIRAAHAVGALAYVDAVHAAPHLPIDVRQLDADVLVTSPYKFFGPHSGMLYGRRELLERLTAYRVRPAGDALPGKWETGTANHEALAGLLGTFAYLEEVGAAYGGAAHATDRHTRLHAAMTTIRDHERGLSAAVLERLAGVPGLRLYGITDPARLDERVPTFSFTLAGHSPQAVAAHLASRAISVWDGDFYAWEVVRALGLAGSGGLVRIGLVHYNTLQEVDRLVEALHELVGHGR